MVSRFVWQTEVTEHHTNENGVDWLSNTISYYFNAVVWFNLLNLNVFINYVFVGERMIRSWGPIFMVVQQPVQAALRSFARKQAGDSFKWGSAKRVVAILLEIVS